MPVHGIDNGNNKHEVYTTEELLSILQQAINSGSLQGIDPTQTPIVAAVRESHNNSNVTFWSGTEAEFNELTGVTSELVGARIGSDGKLYILTGDTTLSDTVEAARQAALEATEGMKREVISVTLPALGWSNTAPYTQTVAVPGMTADKDFLAPYVVPTGNESDDIAAQAALSCISGGTTDTDSVTFYCYDEKPTTTITVFMVDKGTKIESGDFPIASKAALGIMQVGDGLDVDENGKVSSSSYGKTMFSFNNVDAMISSNLSVGNIAVVAGNNAVNDGEGATYSINSNSGELTLNNGLYAKRINDFNANYYDEVGLKSGFVKDTYGKTKSIYYISTIPVNDKFGNPITLHVVGNENLYPSEYAQKHNSTLTTNASLSFEVNDEWINGITIGDGVVLNDYDGTNYPSDYGAYLGIKDDNVIQMYPKTTTSAAMLADGVKQCVFCFGNIVTNGAVNENAYHVDQGTMSAALGQKADGTIVLFGNEGRGLDTYGLTVREVAELLISEGCVNAWELDGGGSFSMSYHGTKINRDYDESRTKERKISYFFNVQHEIKNKKVADDVSAQGQIERIKDKVIQNRFNATEKIHQYMKFRVEESQFVESGQYESQKLILRGADPWIGSGRIFPQYDEDGNLVGFKFFAPCYYKIGYTLQVENMTNNDLNFYCAVFSGTTKEYQESVSLKGKEFKPVSLEYFAQYIADLGKEISIRIWGGNLTSDDQVQIFRGVGHVELIPIDNTY